MPLATKIAALAAGVVGAAAIALPLMAQTASTAPRPVPPRVSAALPQAPQTGAARSHQNEAREAMASEMNPISPPPQVGLPKK